MNRKHDISNIIDFDIAQMNPKYDDDFNINENLKWVVSKKGDKVKFNIKNIIPEKHLRYKSILLDIRYFFNCEKQISSISTIRCHFIYFKPFFNYILKEEKDVLEFEDIDYHVLYRYVNFLKREKSAYTKYRRLKTFLGSISKYKNIKLSSDIKNKNYPLINFNPISKDKIRHYTDEEYDIFRKTIIQIITDYLDKKGNIKEHIFVKACYWAFSIMTGFNKKALDGLSFESISIIKENDSEKTYLIIGEKNRSKSGYQSCNLVISKNKIHLFERIIKELKNINNKYKDSIESSYQNSLWVYFNNVSSFKKILVYEGSIRNFTETKQYKDILSLYSDKKINISSMKNRKKWALEMFDISKSEQTVSKMMNHNNVNITVGHYLKYEISNEIKLKFNIFQELMNSFAKNNKFNDWVKFQEAFGIKDLDSDCIYKGIKNGDFDTGLGKCLNKIKQDGNYCQSYLNCFGCKNFSIIGDKDIWKIISFRDSLNEETIGTEKYKNIYEPIILSINKTLIDFDDDIIKKGKALLTTYGRHPFWKNKTMLKSLIKQFEEIV